MEIRFHLWGGGISIPKTKFGVTALMGASIIIRSGSIEQNFLIYDGFEIGGKSGTLLASFVETEWLSIESSEHPWAATCESFKGDTFEVVVSGTIANRGYVDITLSKIDDKHDKTILLKKYNVEAFGGQIAETKVTGKMQVKQGTRCVLPDDMKEKSFFAT